MSSQSTEDEEDPTEQPAGAASRRKFMVAGAATWTSVSLAGCLGDDDDDDDDDDDEPANDNDENDNDENDDEDPRNYVYTDELIAGSEGVPDAAGFAAPCSPQRTYVPGMQAVPIIGVWDPETGTSLGPEVIDEVVVEWDNGDRVEMEWDEEDEDWHTGYVIPEDTEPGDLGYTVEITNGDNYQHVGVLESEVSVIEFDDPVANYVVTTDTYTGSAGIPEDNAFVSACSPENTYGPEMMVGFEIGIYDSSTGEIVGDDVVDECLVEFDRVDEPLEATFDDEDEYWGAVWYVPADPETGTVEFEVQVTNEGEFHRVGIQEDTFEIVDP